MFCKNCGNQLPDNSKFCPACGAAQEQTSIPQQQPIQQPVQQQPFQQQQFTGQGNPVYVQQPPVVYGPVGMKWHKFLVYFALWAGALINVINGISCFLGLQYGDVREYVYDVIPGLKAADVFYGAVCMCLATLGIVAAIFLLMYKRRGPVFLCAMYGVTFVGTLVYFLWALSILKDVGASLGSTSATIIGSLGGAIAGLVINIVYYRKRRQLFNR